jgi:hypothetical protein
VTFIFKTPRTVVFAHSIAVQAATANGRSMASAAAHFKVVSGAARVLAGPRAAFPGHSSRLPPSTRYGQNPLRGAVALFSLSFKLKNPVAFATIHFLTDFYPRIKTGKALTALPPGHNLALERTQHLVSGNTNKQRLFRHSSLVRRTAVSGELFASGN